MAFPPFHQVNPDLVVWAFDIIKNEYPASLEQRDAGTDTRLTISAINKDEIEMLKRQFVANGVVRQGLQNLKDVSEPFLLKAIFDRLVPCGIVFNTCDKATSLCKPDR